MENQPKNRYNSAKRLIKKRLPILQWLPEYNGEKLASDMIAGITVGLTVMPQGLAYAALAGLQPQVNKKQIPLMNDDFF